MIDEIDTAKMSARGQIIIPKNIRDYIHAKENTLFTMLPLDNDTVIMKKLDKKKILAEFRSIRNKVKKLSASEISKEIKQYRKAK